MIGYHQMEPLKSDSLRKKETKNENKETKPVNKINDTTITSYLPMILIDNMNMKKANAQLLLSLFALHNCFSSLMGCAFSHASIMPKTIDLS